MYSHKSVIAKKMYEAMSHFLLSFNLLMNISENISFDNELCKDFIKHLAQCYRLEHIVASFPAPKIQLITSIANAIISHIHSLKKIKDEDLDPNLHKALLDLDQDARLCFAILNLGSPNTVIEFLSDSMKKYPHNKEFLLFRGNAYSFEQRYEDALRDYNRLLEMEPDNYQFLYYKAVSLRLMGLSNAIQAYEEYISKAPIDERKRPEAYYAMGTCTMVSSKESGNKTIEEKIVKEIKKYYELGLEAEKKQLPFFLPYESNSKRMLEVLLKPEKLLEKKELSSSTEQTKLKDPSRKEIILQHRQSINDFRKTIPKGFVSLPTTINPPKQQKLPVSLIGLKSAYINEIDFTKDHVLSGYVLEVTVIDIPLRTGMSIMLVVEDKNNHVQRVALYNFNENIASAEELGVGSKLSIINPYIRMAQDGKPLIRVDDPSSVILCGKNVNMCAHCGNLSASSVCGGCNTTKYCSKECQARDWKEFQHKLICIKNTK